MTHRCRVARGLTVILLSGACSPASTPDRPNIVLITVDTLRADALGLYAGGKARRTPNIDGLGREGVVFDNAVCPMPQTRPSHFSILTSQYPREHGVVNNAIALPDGATTLAEVLKSSGWETAGFVAVSFLGAESGAAQGFDTFEGPSARALTADEAVPRALRWLEARRDGQRPFFLWLHVFDPHMPYAPPAAYRPPPATGLGEAPTEISWPVLLARAKRSGGRLPAALLEYGQELYRGEVAFVDHWLGKLFQALRDPSRGGRTVIVLTSDHGECFDHGIFFEHSDCLYDASVRVPLVLWGPGVGKPGTREPRTVENLDLAPTLLRLAGVAAPASFRGRSFLHDTPPDGRGFLQRPLYQSLAAENRPQRNAQIRSIGDEKLRPIMPAVDIVGLRSRDWKYLNYGEGEELYYLPGDPEERANLAESRLAELRRSRLLLEQWLRAHPLRLGDQTTINPELRESLRALGYLN
jgi:arylsulfatase A-like enzyme